jgi:hypothetical protein
MTFKKLLDNLVILEFIRSDAKNLIGLFSSYETAFDTKTFLSDLFSTLVAKLFHLALHALFVKIAPNFI